MFLRRRPLLRAAVVGGGAYVAGKRVGQHKTEQPEQEAQQSVSDQLAKLSTLHQQGALNDSEFATAKAKLLGS